MPDSLPDIEILTHAGLPVVAAFFRRLGLVEAIDHAVPSEMEVSVGNHVLAMVLDCLTGRMPLYKVSDTFCSAETELLFGRHFDPEQFNDDALARALDRIQAVGAGSLFSRLAMQACRKMEVPLDCGNFDVTSITVYGDDYQSDCEESIEIRHGHSKDHRPDLRQFLVRQLCVGGNIPVLGGANSGNESERRINNHELTQLGQLLKEHGIERSDFTYVADCAVVNEENIHALDGMNFVTRLPASYGAHNQLIDEALEEGVDKWTDLGTLAQEPPTPSRPHASYRALERPLKLYGRNLRAFVIYSDRHDKRKLKAVKRAIEKELAELSRLIKKETAIQYACSDDARHAVERLRKKVDASQYHRLSGGTSIEPRYCRGRPSKDGRRRVESYDPVLDVKLVENEQAIKQAKLRAGCFVLIARQPAEKDCAEVLRTYKSQHGVERNFAFLKDDSITNSIFLKKPERIEALTFILLLSLLIWNLIQYKAREWISKHQQALPGLDNQPTYKPTTKTILGYFRHVTTYRLNGKWHLPKPLSREIMAYLQALELGPWIFLNPTMKPK